MLPARHTAAYLDSHTGLQCRRRAPVCFGVFANPHPASGPLCGVRPYETGIQPRSITTLASARLEKISAFKHSSPGNGGPSAPGADKATTKPGRCKCALGRGHAACRAEAAIDPITVIAKAGGRVAQAAASSPSRTVTPLICHPSEPGTMSYSSTYSAPAWSVTSTLCTILPSSSRNSLKRRSSGRQTIG